MADRKQKSKTSKTPKGRAKAKRAPMRTAYVCECPVCGNGLVRFWKFREEVVAMCGECELVWSDVAMLGRGELVKAVGSYPGGEGGKGSESDWKRATWRTVEKAGLVEFVAGHSD